MDDRLFKFAEIYSMMVFGLGPLPEPPGYHPTAPHVAPPPPRVMAPRPVVPEPMPAPRMRAPLPEPSLPRFPLPGEPLYQAKPPPAAAEPVAQVPKGTWFSKMMSSIGKGISSAFKPGEVPERVQNLMKEVGEVKLDKGSWKVSGLDENMAKLREAGYSNEELAQARSQAIKLQISQNMGSSIEAFGKSVDRAMNRAQDMYVKVRGGGGIQGLLAKAKLPTMKQAIIVSVGLGILYYLFTGGKPKTSSDDTKIIVDAVPQLSGPPIIPDLLPRIDGVVGIAQKANKQDVVQALGAVKTAMSSISQVQLHLDDASTGTAFTQAVRSAESAINSVLPLLDSLTQAVQGNDQAKVQQLKGGFGEFLLEIEHIRGAA